MNDSSQSPKRLRVLISAYACEPGKGSEPGVGWNLIKHISKEVDVWVVTRANNRSAILGSGEAWVKEVHWTFWDPPKYLTFWKGGGRGVQAFYILWQILVISTCRKLVITNQIQITHHVTFGKYWVPSLLPLLSIPFVFGPVGGGERSPDKFADSENIRAKASTWTKSIGSFLLTRNPLSRTLYRRCAWTFAATNQTEENLRSLGMSKVSILPQSGISEDEIPTPRLSKRTRSSATPLRLVTAARLIHWKAIDLAIEAVALARKQIPVHLTILQDGPERASLEELCGNRGVSDIVEFKGKLPSLQEVYLEIATSDALVHPALHEAFGQACLESLALGTPVICLNWGGPGIIVDSQSGYAVSPGNRNETIQRLATSLISLHQSYLSGKDEVLSRYCRHRAMSVFHWNSVAKTILEKYHEVSHKVYQHGG